MSTTTPDDRTRERSIHADRLRHRVLPGRDLFTPARMLELPDCTIVSGVADTAAPPAPLFAPGEPRMALIHYIDTGNPVMMSTGFLLGGIAIVLVEIIWWVAGHVSHGERRRIWSSAR